MPFDQPVPRPFVSTAVQAFAPSAPGVYGISNAREWIYIGETEDIQQALLGHLRDADAALMKHGPTGFVFEVCDSAKRPARQDRLVFEYEPACNRHSPRHL